MIRVVHLREEPFDIRIDRPSKWGNPYRVGPDGFIEQVLAKYEAHVRANLMDDLHELKGLTLGCWCKKKARPKPCHGDVLVKLVEEVYGEEAA